jgi:light-regulated signal transduction histidine kinase (bacteriophytochrome)
MSESEQSPDTELARLRAELESTRRQLSTAQAGLADYAYSVSHDLRANLRHITSYVALVREELPQASSADVKAYLDIVTTAAKLMGRQIDALMRWSQLDRATLMETPVNLPALVAEVCQALAGEAAGRQIEWQVAADFPSLRGDVGLLRELFIHLLSNALKFTRPREKAVIEVGWRPSEEKGRCVVVVRDNGVGFNRREQDKMFRVFQRLHSGNEFEGLGMGLALARKIVALHDGNIQVEGEPDAGCQVSFTLQLSSRT